METKVDQNYNEKNYITKFWDAAKAVLRGKFIALSAYIKKEESCQINV